MSISFFVEEGNITGYSIECFCGKGHLQMETYAEAHEWLRTRSNNIYGGLVPGCDGRDEYCRVDIPKIVVHSDNSDVAPVRMSGSNARYILNALKLKDDAGVIDPYELTSRITAYGIESVHANREDGSYVLTKLEKMMILANIAEKRGINVCWS